MSSFWLFSLVPPNFEATACRSGSKMDKRSLLFSFLPVELTVLGESVPEVLPPSSELPELAKLTSSSLADCSVPHVASILYKKHKLLIKPVIYFTAMNVLPVTRAVNWGRQSGSIIKRLQNRFRVYEYFRFLWKRRQHFWQVFDRSDASHWISWLYYIES